MIEIKRMWINQPSTLQSLHHLNGLNVLAVHEDDSIMMRIYFLSGDVISMQAPKLALSDGWITQDRKPLGITLLDGFGSFTV